ncbi:hypothetical protein AZZ93_002017, partial [Escherichia coli]
ESGPCYRSECSGDHFRRRYTTTGRDQYVNQTTGGQYHQATPRHGI